MVSVIYHVWTVVMGMLAFLERSASFNLTSTLCQRSLMVENGSMNISEALQGMHLKVGTGLIIDAFLRRDQNGKYSGLEEAMLTELAKRAGFSWNYVIETQLLGETWSQTLKRMVKQYDLVTYCYWTITADRAKEGAFSPTGFLDVSIRMATLAQRPEEDSLSVKMFQFIKPFEPNVWVAFLCLAVLTASVFLFIEFRDEEVFPNGFGPRGLFQSLYLGLCQLTGAGAFGAKDWAGKILEVSWGWCILLFVAIYTANLASFLVYSKRPTLRYTGLPDAIQKNARICFETGPVHDWFRKTYPTYNNWMVVHQTASGKMPLKHLGIGDCQVALLQRFGWELGSRDSSFNQGCNAQLLGEPLLNLAAGWMMGLDYTSRCLAVKRDAISYHLWAMQDDGTLDAMVNGLYRELSDGTCPAGYSRRLKGKASGGGASGGAAAAAAGSDADEHLEKADLASMSGVLIVHGLGITLALVCFSVGKAEPLAKLWCRKRRNKGIDDCKVSQELAPTIRDAGRPDSDMQHVVPNSTVVESPIRERFDRLENSVSELQATMLQVLTKLTAMDDRTSQRFDKLDNSFLEANHRISELEGASRKKSSL